MFLKLLAINEYPMHWIPFYPLTIPDFINFTAHWRKTHGFRFLECLMVFLLENYFQSWVRGFTFILSCAFINPVSNSDISVLFNL